MQYHKRPILLGCLEKGLELLHANGGRLEKKQFLFADDTALAREFGSECKRSKLQLASESM